MIRNEENIDPFQILSNQLLDLIACRSCRIKQIGYIEPFIHLDKIFFIFKNNIAKSITDEILLSNSNELTSSLEKI